MPQQTDKGDSLGLMPGLKKLEEFLILKFNSRSFHIINFGMDVPYQTKRPFLAPFT